MKTLFALAAVAALSLATPAVGQVGSVVTFAHQNGASTFESTTLTVQNGNADTYTFGDASGYTANLDAGLLTVDFFAPATTPCTGRFCPPSDNVFLNGAGLLITSSDFDFASIISGLTITNTGGYGFTAGDVSLVGSNGIFFNFGGDYNNASGFTAAFATTAVPEPATWAMMLMGFGAMGLSLRRRHKLTNFAQLA
jgi:hypothetical protein